MIDKRLLHALRVAFALSGEQKRPFFVFCPPRARVVITDDEAVAAQKCGTDGYTRCDAAQETLATALHAQRSRFMKG